MRRKPRIPVNSGGPEFMHQPDPSIDLPDGPQPPLIWDERLGHVNRVRGWLWSGGAAGVGESVEQQQIAVDDFRRLCCDVVEMRDVLTKWFSEEFGVIVHHEMSWEQIEKYHARAADMRRLGLIP